MRFSGTSTLLKFSGDSPPSTDPSRPPPGLLSIGRPLDRESRKRYSLNITASDHGQPPQAASARVSITVEDVNDNQPIFSRTVYGANISERAPVGAFVTRVSAADRDEGESNELLTGTPCTRANKNE